MTHQFETNTSALCAAIEAALRISEAEDNTLVSALLSEALEAASCDDREMQAE